MNRRSLAAAFVAVGLTIGGIAVASAAYAAPNTETVLPADGVLAVAYEGNETWSISTDGEPWEVKLMEPSQAVVCGTNYADPCSSVETFTAPGGCVYLQVDWQGGAHNSSDPFVCVQTPGTPTEEPPTSPSSTSTPTDSPTSTPSSTPVPSTPPTSTPPASPSPTPTPSGTSSPEPTPSATPTVHCEPPYVPGWLDENGNPTSCVYDGPMTYPTGTPKPTATTPSPSATGTPTENPSPPSEAAAPVGTGSSTPSTISAETELASTGIEWLPLAVLASVLALVGVGITVQRYHRRNEDRS